MCPSADQLVPSLLVQLGCFRILRKFVLAMELPCGTKPVEPHHSTSCNNQCMYIQCYIVMKPLIVVIGECDTKNDVVIIMLCKFIV